LENLREIVVRIVDVTTEAFAGFDGDYLSYATMIIRFFLPALAIIIVTRCIKSLLRERSEDEIWGQLKMENGTLIDLIFWENTIGRAKASDVFLGYQSVSRNHAALNRDDKGNWQIFDIESKAGVLVNGKKAEGSGGVPVKSGDHIDLGGVRLIFIAADNTDEYEQAASRTRPGRFFKQRTTLVFLTEFQLLLAVQLCISVGEELTMLIPLCFLALIIIMWISYFITRAMKRIAFEIETIGFFLCSIGLGVVASGSPDDLIRQIFYIILGIVMFFVLGWFLRDLDRAKALRRPIALLGPVLLALTLVYGYITGTRTHGAIRWIYIAGISVQPSEFVKIAIIFAGAATLERMFARRNLFGFIGLMGACMGILALMSDFGSALIFFIAYLLIAFMRSGDFATIFLSIAGAGFAGLVALTSRPYIAERFATWGKAWEYSQAGGYQQSRAMAAAASGGLFGVGAGNGWFKRVFAADSDLVFAMVSEELGLLVALCAMFAIIIFAVYSVKAAGSARSSFHVIAACAASSILVFQMLLNVLGSMDILPFTGVTFPFVSKGGTSLVACWATLAFFKAVDTRQNASFVVKTPKRPLYSGGGALLYKREVEGAFWEDGAR